jgi:hypothetical protein
MVFSSSSLFSSAFYSAFDLGSQFGAAKREQEIKSEKNTAEAETQIKDRCLALKPAEMADCIHKIEKAANKDDREEHDLYAQRQMAQWAWAMVLVSAGTLLATCIGVVFVGLTLGEARKTTGAAIAAAEASVVMNKLMIEQNEPVVYAREIVGVGDKSQRYSVNIGNIGKSPAFINEYCVNVIRCETIPHTPPYASPTRIVIPLAPEATDTLISNEVASSMSLEEQGKIREGSMLVIAFGYIIYTTSSHRRFKLGFAWKHSQGVGSTYLVK